MGKIVLIIVIGMAVLIPSASFAAEEKFFEYATDVGVPIEVPTGSAAIQEFKVFNDYVVGADVWFDNIGSSGSATFALLDSANNVLTSKSVTVTHSDPFYSGERLHVKFSKMVAVNSGDWYKLRITSASARLRLYGIKRVQFVEHNAPYPVDYSVGSSLLNGEAQFSVYKFALYEDIDAEPPIITNASTSIAGPDAMRLSFNANELADRSLTYSVIGSDVISTIGFTGNYTICFEGVYACPITFDVQRNAVYAYRLTARDSWGNESYVDGAFESWKPGATIPPPTEPPVTPPGETPPPVTPPETPPSIPLAIDNERVVAVTRSSVMIAWDTSRAANAVLTVSTDPVGGTILKTVTDSTHELTHTLAIPDVLAANTPYYATIVSHDQAGAVAAKVVPFTTLAASATTTLPVLPGASTQQVHAVISEDQQSMTVSWEVPLSGGEPAKGYRIDVIDAQGNLFQTKTVSPGTHTVVVTGLTEGGYRAVVYADKDGVVEKVAEPAIAYARKSAPPIDTYELIKKPIVYIPAILFGMLIGGLYWYSKRQKKIEK